MITIIVIIALFLTIRYWGMALLAAACVALAIVMGPFIIAGHVFEFICQALHRQPQKPDRKPQGGEPGVLKCLTPVLQMRREQEWREAWREAGRQGLE